MRSLSLATTNALTLPIPGADPWHADPNDPALTVMTDFRERASITVSEISTIDAALDHMKHTGVRCAFAIDDENRVVVGLITAYDIMSEKPMRQMRSVHTPRHEILVRDIMQRIADWRVADIRELERATVVDVARLLEESGLTHIPVLETGERGERRLRGILSQARVRRLLSKTESVTGPHSHATA
jgi:CBS domain-containing protein